MGRPCDILVLWICDEWGIPKWAWSGSREQFLHCGLRKFRHSKSSGLQVIYTTRPSAVCLWHWDNGSRLGRVMVECTLSITHCLRLNLQLHTIDLVRTCCISSLCTVAWQLARFQLTRRIARSLGDSWASCGDYSEKYYLALYCCHVMAVLLGLSHMTTSFGHWRSCTGCLATSWIVLRSVAQ